MCACAVETLQELVNRSVGGAVGHQMSSCQGPPGGSVGPVCLPRRAETFGGFDSHQMNISKSKTQIKPIQKLQQLNPFTLNLYRSTEFNITEHFPQMERKMRVRTCEERSQIVC